MKCTIIFSLCVGALGVQLTAASAIEMPEFNITAICRAGSGQVITFAECTRGEQEARDQLAKQWAQLGQSDATSCVQDVKSVRGSESYVELLTCLQIAKNKTARPDPFGPLPVIEDERKR